MKSKDQNILFNYFSGNAHTEEERELEKRLQTTENKKNFKDIAKTDHLIKLATSAFDSDKAYSAFEEMTAPKHRGIFEIIGPFYRYAAVLAVVFLLSFFLFNNVLVVNPKMITVAVPAGMDKQLVLPDGTQVQINSKSQLTYPESFEKGRKVALQGEAIFKVSRNGTPFIVTIDNDTHIRVLGTVFNIKAYPEDKRIELALKEGKVELVSNYIENKKIELQPSDIVKIDKPNRSVTVLHDSESTTKSMLWSRNVLSFNGDYLADIINEIKRIKNTRIDITGDELPYLIFTATFDKTTPVEEILNDLSITGRFTVKKINDNHFVLRKVN